MPEENFKRGERTREDIIESAYQLFLERGFHGTSMRQIAQKAGIAVGGIYNHFSSKEDIFIAAFLAHHPYYEVLKAMDGAEGETIEAFINDAAGRMVAALGERLDFINLLFIELVEFNGQHIPDLFKVIFPQVMAFGQRFLENQDQLRTIPLPVLLRAFLGLFFSYVITELLMSQQMPPEMRENSLNYFVDIYLHGILARD